MAFPWHIQLFTKSSKEIFYWKIFLWGKIKKKILEYVMGSSNISGKIHFFIFIANLISYASNLNILQFLYYLSVISQMKMRLK